MLFRNIRAKSFVILSQKPAVRMYLTFYFSLLTIKHVVLVIKSINITVTSWMKPWFHRFIRLIVINFKTWLADKNKVYLRLTSVSWVCKINKLCTPIFVPLCLYLDYIFETNFTTLVTWFTKKSNLDISQNLKLEN